MQNRIIKNIILLLLIFIIKIDVCLALSDYYLDGLKYYYKLTPKNNDKAIEMFKLAIEKKVDVAISRAVLSCALIKKYGYEGAKDKNLLDHAKQEAWLSLSIDEKLPEAYKALGIYYLTMGDRKRAMAEFENALKIKPDYGDCIANIGSIYIGDGNLKKAEEYYKKALEIQPDNLFAKRTLASFYAYKTGKIHKGVRIFKEILKEYPEDLNSYLYLGEIYYSIRLYDDALEFFKKALEIEKDYKWIKDKIEEIEKFINEK